MIPKTSRVILCLLALFSFTAQAGSISGSVSYSGSTTGELIVALFSDPSFSGRPPYQSILASPGPYTFNGLSDGTYYVGAVIFTDTTNSIKPTDPWAVYGTPQNPTPVVLSGGVNVTGINLTLVDGTAQNPNPFYKEPLEPKLTLHLSESARDGWNAALATDGASIYLFKQDYAGSSSAKLFTIDPATGNTTATSLLSLQSLPNCASWIDDIVFYKGALWALGGYGDPSSLTVKTGVFRFDPATSTTSSEVPAGGTGLNSLATDGTYLYVGMDYFGSDTVCGIIKFDPAGVSQIPPFPTVIINDRLTGLCYGDSCLWTWTEGLSKLDPVTGKVLATFEISPSEESMYLNGMFWTYDESDSTIKAYALEGTTSVGQRAQTIPENYSLSQNYPNPFNPSTTIRYSVPARSLVTLIVYNALGQKVAQLVNEVKEAGDYTARFSAGGIASGVCFYRLQAGSFTETKKMVLVR